MRKFEIESWASRVIEQVENNQPLEDSRVELKSGWQEPERIAREIAGHANAAHGDPILWLIGVHEKKGVVGVEFQEFSNWFQSIRAEFNELAPEVQEVNIPRGEKTVVALLFETDRFPYVTRNPAFGTKGDPVKWEVPWRDGQTTRTATRTDLIRLLSPLLPQPTVEVLDGSLLLFTDDAVAAGIQAQEFRWVLDLSCYIVPKDIPLVISFHHCNVEFEIPDCVARCSLRHIDFSVDDLADVTNSRSEIIIRQPARIELHASLTAGRPENLECLCNDVLVTLHFVPAYFENPVVVTDTLHYQQPSGTGRVINKWISRHHWS